jgi:hypothetical protein
MNDLQSRLTAVMERKASEADVSIDFRFRSGDVPTVAVREVRTLTYRWVRPALGLAAVVVLIVALVAVSTRHDPGTETPGGGSTSSVPQLNVTTDPGPLMTTSFTPDQAPLVLIDQPSWVITYVHGTDDLPLGDLSTDRLILVGDGPRYDAPSFQAWSVTPPQGYDLTSYGQPVSIGSISARIDERATDPDTGLAGPVISLAWELGDGRLANIIAVRIPRESLLGMAAALDFSSTTPTMPPTPGFTKVDITAPPTWLTFEYQYAQGKQTVQLDGANFGVLSLLSNMGGEVRTTRTVDGTEIAFRPLPNEPGRYRADWQLGQWAYYVDAQGFGSEDEFLAILGKLMVTTPNEFTSVSAALNPLVPGDRLPLVQELEQGIQLPSNTPTAEWPVSAVASTRSEFEFGFYFGIGCGWKNAWLAADTVNDPNAKAAALAGVQSILTKLGDPQSGVATLPSELSTAMQSGNRDAVSQQGSNDCPTWSDNLGT